MGPTIELATIYFSMFAISEAIHHFFISKSSLTLKLHNLLNNDLGTRGGKYRHFLSSNISINFRNIKKCCGMCKIETIIYSPVKLNLPMYSQRVYIRTCSCQPFRFGTQVEQFLPICDLCTRFIAFFYIVLGLWVKNEKRVFVLACT